MVFSMEKCCLVKERLLVSRTLCKLYWGYVSSCHQNAEADAFKALNTISYSLPPISIRHFVRVQYLVF